MMLLRLWGIDGMSEEDADAEVEIDVGIGDDAGDGDGEDGTGAASSDPKSRFHKDLPSFGSVFVNSETVLDGISSIIPTSSPSIKRASTCVPNGILMISISGRT